jgi:hypothetical protein
MNGPSQTTPPPPPPSFSPQPAPPPRKGLSPLAWIGIGCGALAVLAAIGFTVMVVAGGWFLKKQADKLEKNPTLTVAEWYVRANPDYEIVSADEESGTITIREIKTGEQMTVNAKDLQEGKLKVKTKDGTAVFDASAKDGTIKVTDEKGGQVATLQAGGDAPKNLPSWLPIYPGGSVQGTFDTKSADGRSASVTLTTPDTGDKVLSFYESRLKEAGLKVDSTTVTSTAEGKGGILTASGGNPHREVSVLVGSSEGQTTAAITFQEKR